MFKNMRYPSVIVGVRLEPRGKHVIPVLPGNMDVFGARLVVREVDCSQLQFGHGFCTLDGEAVELVAGKRQLGESRGIAADIGALFGSELARERQATAKHCAVCVWGGGIRGGV